MVYLNLLPELCPFMTNYELDLKKKNPQKTEEL